MKSEQHTRTTADQLDLAQLRVARVRRWTVRSLIAGMVIAATLLLGRVYALVARAPDASPRTVTIPARRGWLYDRERRVLAGTVAYGLVVVEPEKVRQLFADDLSEFVAKVASALTMNRDIVSARLRAKGDEIELKRGIEPEQVDALGRIRVGKRRRAVVGAGVHVRKDFRRIYPGGELAAHVLGFTAASGAGVEGIERQYDRLLRGKARTMPSVHDGSAKVIYSDAPPVVEMGEGASLLLTIDAAIQASVERVLREGVAHSQARAGHVVVMEPRTGAILALANHPTFDPNQVGSDADVRRNRAVIDLFEPGSPIKTFTIAGAYAAGLVTSTSMIDCHGGVRRFGRRTIHDTHPHGWLTVRDTLVESSNVGASEIGDLLTAQGLHGVLTQFGFGRRTGIDLPLEGRGTLRPAASWMPFDAAAASFGQGMSVTNLQLAAAMGTIANGGVWVRPYLVARVLDTDGGVLLETPVVGRPVVSEEVAHAVTSMLEGVVAPGKTGERARLEEHAVAGKTGTAQKAEGRRGYTAGAYTASFVGFAPAYAPRLVVSVVIDEPRGDHAGGVVAAPLFRTIMDESLRILGVPVEASPLATLPGPSRANLGREKSK